jgi:hypothetical protein
VHYHLSHFSSPTGHFSSQHFIYLCIVMLARSSKCFLKVLYLWLLVGIWYATFDFVWNCIWATSAFLNLFF